MGAIASDSRISRVSLLNSEVPLGAIASESRISRVIDLTSEVPLGAIGSNATVQRVIGLTSEVPLGAIGSEVVIPSRDLWTFANTTTELWLDAADASTITLTSSAVSQWSDKSGNNRHSTQSVSDSRPIVATAALNSLDGIQFDGVNDFLEIVGYAACNTPSSDSFILVVCESSGTARRGIMGTRPAANAEGWFLSYLSVPTANPAVVFTGVSGASAIGSFRTPDILGFQKTATTCQIISFLNTPNTPTTMTLIPVSSIESTKIGREMTGQAGESLLGKIYEIVEIPTIDATTLQKAEGYLAHKWGLTANLPVDHPYKNSPPTV